VTTRACDCHLDEINQGIGMKCVLLTAALIGLSTQAHADWEYAHWGMTPEQVIAASNGAAKMLPREQQRSNDAIKMTTKVQAVYSDGPLKFEVMFSFDPENHLAGVGYETRDPNQSETLKNWVTKRYGPPTNTDAELQRTQMFNWTKPDTILLIITDGEGASAMQFQRGQ
jgi:hypothetical protein